jgi:opacity protein-like surface antigen
MTSATRAFALITGLVLSGLVSIPAAIAADVEPIVEEAAGIGWYVSIFGGPKWGDGDIDLSWERRRVLNGCILATVECPYYDGELHGEIDNGFLLGAAVGAQLTDNLRAELEVSGARLDTETHVEEYVSYGVELGRTNEAADDDKLRELFILANVWFGIPLSSVFSPYIGGGVGVAHVDAEFGVDPFASGMQANDLFSASVEADDWTFAYQLGAGILIGLSENVAIDLGYRFKVISNVELDDPEFCGGEHCYPPVVEFDGDDDFDIHEHVAQIGITFGF